MILTACSPVVTTLLLALAFVSRSAGSAHSPRGRTIEGRGREQLDSNKIYECADGDCYIVCADPYELVDGECAKSIVARAVSPCEEDPDPTPTSGSVGAWLSAQGVDHFHGKNTGTGSWYRANSKSDGSNGHSWCGYRFKDSTPGFAPSRDTMLSDFGWSASKAKKGYCGLEARVTAPNGRSSLLYIVDAMDSKYVRSPGSINIVHDAFTYLFKKSTSNKKDVIKGVKWELTGKRSTKFSFGGPGSG